MASKGFLSIKDFPREEIETLLAEAADFKREKPGPLLQGKILANCFFEPSTRTQLSFATAMKRLGGEVIGFGGDSNLSTQKGETLHDTIKVVGQYADVLVIRHPLEGAAKIAAEATNKPVINAGDGANEHPTQTLVDLFSIQECQGKIDGLNIVFAGDLLHGRTVHSLVYALQNYDVRLFFVAPHELRLPDALCDRLRRSGIPFSFHAGLDEVIGQADILYMTRIQKERFSTPVDMGWLGEKIAVNTGHLEKCKKNMRILHPLPRLFEIPQEIDSSPHSYYFTQAENGVYVRSALLQKVVQHG